MKNKTLAVLVLLMMFSAAFMPPAVFAGEQEMLDRVTNDKWTVRAPWRLLHGVANLGLSPTQLIVEPYHSIKHEGDNVLRGVADGIGGTFYYAALGAWDVITFWVPGQAGKDIAVKECILKPLAGACCEKK